MLYGKHKTVGFLGMLGLLMVYFLILTLSEAVLGGLGFSESLGHTLGRFGEMWYLVLILSAGFGIQLGLFSFVKSGTSQSMKAAGTEVAAAGGISTASMVACCAHHITDFLPMLGLSAASIFLAKYQIPFIVLGIFSNLIGITIMLSLIQKHKLYSGNGAFGSFFRLDMTALRNIAIVISVLAVSSSFVLASASDTNPTEAGANSGEINLPEIEKGANGVTFTIRPIKFNLDKPVKFHIRIETHSGSLAFDLTEISLLEDGNGGMYEAIHWEGSPPGGHHRKGTLIFPGLKGNPESMKLVVKNVNGVAERIFEWKLTGTGSAA